MYFIPSIDDHFIHAYICHNNFFRYLDGLTTYDYMLFVVLAGCLPNEFRCENGVCILTSDVCAGNDDCGDASDESSSLCPDRK